MSELLFTLFVVVPVIIIWRVYVTPWWRRNINPPAKLPATSERYEGGSRAGRSALWLLCPPIGFWRSVRHSRRSSEQRIIDEIRKDDK